MTEQSHQGFVMLSHASLSTESGIRGSNPLFSFLPFLASSSLVSSVKAAAMNCTVSHPRSSSLKPLFWHVHREASQAKPAYREARKGERERAAQQVSAFSLLNDRTFKDAERKKILLCQTGQGKLQENIICSLLGFRRFSFSSFVTSRCSAVSVSPPRISTDAFFSQKWRLNHVTPILWDCACVDSAVVRRDSRSNSAMLNLVDGQTATCP